MKVHLVDGTYELFRHHFAVPPRRATDGREIAAVRAVLGSMLTLLEDGATHVGVATDQVIESFRNELYDGYKNGEGIDPVLWNQFPLLEETLAAAGFTVWPMVEFEADDAMAAAAAVADADERVTQALICTPDKDLAQSVKGTRIVQFDRRKRLIVDEQGVIDKFGVSPASIPDYLGLVGDSADGFPGLPGWGAKSAAAVLARYGTIEQIPRAAGQWDITVRGAAKLVATLDAHLEDALLFKELATLHTDGPKVGVVDDWLYAGPTDAFEELAGYLDAAGMYKRALALAERSGPPEEF